MNKKFLLIIFIALLASYVYFFRQEEFFNALNETYYFVEEEAPWLRPTLNYASERVMAGDRIGLAIYSFITASPILPFPLEPYLVFSSSAGVSDLEIIIISTFFSTLGRLVNYIFGLLFGVKVVEFVFGTFPGWGERLVEKIGSVVAFLSALFPFPDITAMVLGAYRMSVTNFLVFSMLGGVARSWLVLAGAYKALEYIGYNMSDLVTGFQKSMKLNIP